MIESTDASSIHCGITSMEDCHVDDCRKAPCHIFSDSSSVKHDSTSSDTLEGPNKRTFLKGNATPGYSTGQDRAPTSLSLTSFRRISGSQWNDSASSTLSIPLDASSLQSRCSSPVLAHTCLHSPSASGVRKHGSIKSRQFTDRLLPRATSDRDVKAAVHLPDSDSERGILWKHIRAKFSKRNAVKTFASNEVPLLAAENAQAASSLYPPTHKIPCLCQGESKQQPRATGISSSKRQEGTCHGHTENEQFLTDPLYQVLAPLVNPLFKAPICDAVTAPLSRSTSQRYEGSSLRQQRRRSAPVASGPCLDSGTESEGQTSLVPTEARKRYEEPQLSISSKIPSSNIHSHETVVPSEAPASVGAPRTHLQNKMPPEAYIEVDQASPSQDTAIGHLRQNEGISGSRTPALTMPKFSLGHKQLVDKAGAAKAVPARLRKGRPALTLQTSGVAAHPAALQHTPAQLKRGALASLSLQPSTASQLGKSAPSRLPSIAVDGSARSDRTPTSPEGPPAIADFKVSVIIPGFLYLGPEPASNEDIEELESAGVKRILNMASECNTHERWSDRFEKIATIPMRDSLAETNVQERFQEACTLLDDADLHLKPTFVHCKAGKSRSVTIVLAFLIHRNHWPLKRAYAHVLQRREGVSPNIGFVAELMKFEEKELGVRSRGLFGSGMTPGDDKESFLSGSQANPQAAISTEPVSDTTTSRAARRDLEGRPTFVRHLSFIADTAISVASDKKLRVREQRSSTHINRNRDSMPPSAGFLHYL